MRVSVPTVLAAVATAFLVAGCAGGAQVTDASRSLYVTEHPETPQNFASAILSAQIMVGMTREMVAASWGPPSRSEDIRNDVRGNERWIYGNYLVDNAVSHLYFQDGVMHIFEFVDTKNQQTYQIKDPSERLALQSSPPDGSKGGGHGPP